jgi:molecular chaperone GrpE
MDNTSKNEDDIILEPNQNLDEDSGDDIEYSDENLKDTVKKLKEKVKKLEQENREYLTGWQRTKADYINSKKEAEKNQGELTKYANETLVVELLSALDAFDMAMANKENWEKVDKNWRSGIEYIYNHIISTLERFGVKQEDPTHKEVDIMKHNPIGTVATEDESLKGKVAQVMQKGYTMHGKEIRPASVKVFE